MQSGKLASRRPTGLGDIDYTTRWLLSRQTTVLQTEEQQDDDSEADEEEDDGVIRWAGFSGRCNKIADTCYSWWVGGSLAVRMQFTFSKPLLSPELTNPLL
jgi:geranylgeranyl transferase type-1 subunit beta